MYQIALCDSVSAKLNKTDILLKNYEDSTPGLRFAIRHFTSIRMLQQQIESGKNFDLLLLPVYQSGESGIAEVRELRRMGFTIPVIFIADLKEHAFEAFGIQSAYYLVRPVSQAAFFDAMDWFCQQLESEHRNYIVVKVKHALRRLAVWDIVLCESHGNYQDITLTDKTIVHTRITSSEIFDMLAKNAGFVRCGAAYIVNLNHVQSVSAKEIALDNGSTIPVPRGAYTILKKQYFDFYL